MPPKKKIKNSRTNAPVTTVGESVSTTTVIHRKRPATRRGRNVRVRGPRGGLENMPNMPLDVLFEIFGFLHPRDLLSLARTTEDFRTLLMSRKSVSFWAASRKQIQGLPEIPEYLSEPAYANLLFDNHCHRCLRTGIHVLAYWEVPARYCSACRDIMITSYDADADVRGMVVNCGLTYANDVVTPIYVRSSNRHGYHSSELEEVVTVCTALKTKEDKMEYIRGRRQLVARRQEHARQLSAWEISVKQKAIADEAAIVEGRRAAILAKLRDEGWGEDIDKMTSTVREDLMNMVVVRRPSKLTDRSWSLARAAVVEFMQTVRAARVKAEQTARLQARFKCLWKVLSEYQHKMWLEDKAGYVFVGLADVAAAEEIRVIIEDTSTELTEEFKVQLATLVPNIARRWVNERRAEFTALLLSKLGGDSAAARHPDPLALAIAYFDSSLSHSSCSVNPRWPRILDQPSFRKIYGSNHIDDPFLKALTDSLGSSFWLNGTWNLEYEGQHLCVDSRLAHIRDVIRTCGADPDTATYAHMEECNVRLICRACATMLKREVFDWKAAIAHDFSKHYNGVNSIAEPLVGRWMRISDECAATARTLEAAVLAQPVDYTSKSQKLHCAWCSQHSGDIQRMREHLKWRHDNSLPQQNTDFFLINRDRPSIWMYSDLLSESSAEKAAVRAGVAFFAPL